MDPLLAESSLAVCRRSTVTVTGAPHVIDALVAAAAGSESQLSFGNILAADYVQDSPLQVRNVSPADGWAVLWEPAAVSLDTTLPGRAVFAFTTDWSPPGPAITALSRLFPGTVVTLEFDDVQGKGGRTVLAGGVAVSVVRWPAPAAHADHEARGVCCPCTAGDMPVYGDCLEARTGAVLDDENEVLTAGVLARDGWKHGVDALVVAARTL